MLEVAIQLIRDRVRNEDPDATVAGATPALAPGEVVPVASVAHLIAMKVLARDDTRRPQDWDDLAALTAIATPDDLSEARTALRLHFRGAQYATTSSTIFWSLAGSGVSSRFSSG